MFYPELEEVFKLKDKGNLIPLYIEFDAGSETPLSVYSKVASTPYSFLLESADGIDKDHTYSFIGCEPELIIKTGEGQEYGCIDPLIPIQKELSKYNVVQLPNMPKFKFTGGVVGYLAYESVSYFENLNMSLPNTLGLPESIFMLTKTFLEFDHMKNKIKIITHIDLTGDIEKSYNDAVKKINNLIDKLKSNNTNNEPLNKPNDNKAEVLSNIDMDSYIDIVKSIKKYIFEGDVIQVVPSQRLQRRINVPAIEIYKSLREINPSPYMYFLNFGDFQVAGASPEMLTKVQDGIVSTHPIAGTRPRGENDLEDIQMEKDLLSDPKEIAEHIMLVDLGRNDLGRVCKPGTINVTNFMGIERYSHVMHIVSNVEGELSQDFNNYDAFRSCFPAGTLSGAPKIRAMEIISEMENEKRELYGGAVGHFDFSGNMDTAIAIRTLVIKDGIAYAQSGGGVVFDSEPELEYKETLHKANALLKSIDQAEKKYWNEE